MKMLQWMMRKMMGGMFNNVFDYNFKRMMQEPYTENLFQMYNIMRKVGPNAMFETGMRSETGQPKGAQAAAPLSMKAKNIGEDLRKAKKLKPGEDAVIHTRLPGVNSTEDIITLIQKLKSDYDVPVGIKICATHHMERELEVAVKAGVDFFVVDGAEGGTHGGPPTLQDDVGLPTMFALNRTVNYLKDKGVKDDISVIAAGALNSPGHYLKALALGADAVYIGSTALMAMLQTQMAKALPSDHKINLYFTQGSLQRNWILMRRQNTYPII
jgi:glutamate synthase domain-containing protein 2